MRKPARLDDFSAVVNTIRMLLEMNLRGAGDKPLTASGLGSKFCANFLQNLSDLKKLLVI
jgi:hypothetical protein